MPDSRFSKFMQGRLGSDELNLCLNSIGVALVLINVFAKTTVLTVIILILLVIVVVRSLLPATGINETLNNAFLGLFSGKGGRASGRANDYASDYANEYSDDYAGNPYLDDDFEESLNEQEPEPEPEQQSAPAEPEQPVYAHLECPECHQHMRVPTGMGRVLVTCPACGNKFESES